MSSNDYPEFELNFRPIRVSTLRGERKIPFNAYIKIGKRHVLYCRKGDSFEGARLDRLKEKKLERLYVLDGDIDRYDKYLQDNIDEAFDSSSDKDLLSRTVIIQGHQQALAEDLMESPEVSEHYSIAVSSCFRFVDFMQKHKLALKCMMSLENDNKSISHHGVNVSSLACAMAANFNRDGLDMSNTELLALGCLIHDYGKQELKIPLQSRRDDLTPEQLAVYKKHPAEGIEKLRNLDHFDKIVTDIVMDHEEFIDGSGFPRGLHERQLSPYTLLASVANTYDRLVTFEGMDLPEALKYMIIDSMGLHPLDMMKSLQDALKWGEII